MFCVDSPEVILVASDGFLNVVLRVFWRRLLVSAPGCSRAFGACLCRDLPWEFSWSPVGTSGVSMGLLAVRRQLFRAGLLCVLGQLGSDLVLPLLWAG